MHAELMVLRIVHVVGGILWVGAMAFNAFFLGPAMSASGPAGGQIAAQLQKRGLFVFMPLVAILTILAGIRLLMITSTNFSSAYFGQRNGMTYSIAASIALVAFVYGMAVTRPAMARVVALSQQAASDAANRDQVMAEIRAAQERGRKATVVVTWLLLAAAIGMAIGRYM
ncbi:MAG TPA: hypothetical protein VKH19_02500 [Gemmatimonadaceae bacterium]|nr:hypothetical protein [Gemmatimonadaceae bacterium]